MRNRLETFYGELGRMFTCREILTAVERFLLECEKQARSKAHGRRDELIAVYNELGVVFTGASAGDAQSVAAFEKARSAGNDRFGEGLQPVCNHP